MERTKNNIKEQTTFKVVDKRTMDKGKGKMRIKVKRGTCEIVEFQICEIRAIPMTLRLPRQLPQIRTTSYVTMLRVSRSVVSQ